MPTYTYECKKCGEQQDVFHSISASPRIKCACGGTTRRLLGTGAGLIFKGSGFYETDYKRPAGGATGDKAETSSESKPESKSESKPAAKSEGTPKSSDSGKSKKAAKSS